MPWGHIRLLLCASCSVRILSDLASGSNWLSLTLTRPLRLPWLLLRLLWARDVWVYILLIGVVIPFALSILTCCVWFVLGATSSWSLLLLLLLLLPAAVRTLAVASCPLPPLVKLVTDIVQVNVWETVKA